MHPAHRAALLVLVAALAVAFAILVAAPRSSIDAQTATDNTPTPDVVIEAYTEAGGGPDDGNDNRRGCDLDADRDEMTVELVITDDAPANTKVIVNVQTSTTTRTCAS